MRKKKGFEEYISVPVIILVFFAVMYYFISLAADIDKSRELHLILRRYAMVMESRGCLAGSEQEMLVQELEALGVSNICFNRNPTEKTGYAESVILSVSGTVEVSNVIGYQDFSYIRDGNRLHFEKTLQSTAQH